ncbi:Pre-mRNA cleavage complex II protein Clp1-domain-containing protein [Xylariales sp. AK1849]|nr:Pre-mRNA cleavage complex II protein Clp1-domain-containing protein [Xylariales sp. AK1849]
MSIPGLGSFSSATAPTSAGTSDSTPTTQNVSLQPFWEYRFEVPVSSSLTVRLLSGGAEKDGTELAPNNPYTFSGTKSKINTWQGCKLEVTSTSSGSYDAYISELTEETSLVSYINLHFKLMGLRTSVAKEKPLESMGPRLMVVGPSNSGKTSLVRMLAAWATRMGSQPLVVNTDPSQGMLCLPGTLSAAVFATIMDITTEWGGTPTSGPSGIPVKLPLAYYYGLRDPEDSIKAFKGLLSRLSLATTSRMADDGELRISGMLIDTGPVNASKPNYDYLSHIIAEFSVNIVISLGSERMSAELSKRFLGQKTSLGEEINVIGLDKSGGVVERDEAFMQRVRERSIKEYFFGDARRTLSPGTQNIGFDEVKVWRVGDALSTKSDDEDLYDPTPSVSYVLEKTEPSIMMLNCTLAVMLASVHDSASAIRDANVMGFVYITEVDEKKKRLKVLAPVNARLGDRPLLWGSWPEPMVSLLG